jgi:membrane protein implicated in regulation of membrane protease activity
MSVDHVQEDVEQAPERTKRAANLFDVRLIIAGLFLLYGAILLVMGIGASDADIAKSHGFNANLWVGIALLVTSAIFFAWARWRPLSRELEET